MKYNSMEQMLTKIEDMVKDHFTCNTDADACIDVNDKATTVRIANYLRAKKYKCEILPYNNIYLLIVGHGPQ